MTMIEIKEVQRIILQNVKKMSKDKDTPLVAEIDKEGVFRWDRVLFNLFELTI